MIFLFILFIIIHFIPEGRYKHLIVNYKMNFINADNGTHTYGEYNRLCLARNQVSRFRTRKEHYAG